MENMTEESAGKPLSNTVRFSFHSTKVNTVRERILISKSLINYLKNEELTTHEDKDITTLSSSKIFRQSCMICAGNGVPSPKASSLGRLLASSQPRSKKLHMKKLQSRKQKYMQEIEVCKQNKEGEAENGKKEDELLKVLKQEALQLLKKRENGNHH
nr:high mobility group B protein 6-like [Tanacetum cinerariifolium]